MVNKVKLNVVVKIIAGDDKGKTGKVLKVIPKQNSVLVEGINIRKKAIKPQEGKNFDISECPVHISNVRFERAASDSTKVKKSN